MQKIEVGTIKSTIIKNDLPEIMASVEASITDDSKSVLESTVNKLKKCNKQLGNSLEQLNQYLDSMAEAFRETDEKASKIMEENTVNIIPKDTTAGTARYKGQLP